MPLPKVQNLVLKPPKHLYAAYEHTDAAAELFVLAFSGPTYRKESAENSEGAVTEGELAELRELILANLRAETSVRVRCGRSETHLTSWHAWTYESEDELDQSYCGHSDDYDTAIALLKGRSGRIAHGMAVKIFNFNVTMN